MGECQIHGVSVPTLTGEEAYAGKHMLNLDLSLSAEAVAAAKAADLVSLSFRGKAPAAAAPKGKGKGPPSPKAVDVSRADDAPAASGAPPALMHRASMTRGSLARSSVSRGSLPRGSIIENFPAGVVVHRLSTGSDCSPDDGDDALQLCRDIKEMVGELRDCLKELCAAAGSEPVDASSMAALGSALASLGASAGRVVEVSG